MKAQQDTASNDPIETVKQLFVKDLAGRAWRPVGELQALIPDALAEARCVGVSPLTLADLKDPKEYGRLRLAMDAAQALDDSGACDVRGAEGKKEIRLVVPAGAAAVAAPPPSAADGKDSEVKGAQSVTDGAEQQAGGKDVDGMTDNETAPSDAAVMPSDAGAPPADAPAAGAANADTVEPTVGTFVMPPDSATGSADDGDRGNGPEQPPEAVEKTVPIKHVRVDDEIQPRAQLDLTVVEEYAKEMERCTFPPLRVVFDGNVYWLWDGFHRYRAELKRNSKSVVVVVTAGTRDDALWLALSANKTHGLRRTTADKQRAVLAALGHPKARALSDRAIAEHVGVSSEMVGTHRARLSDSDRQPTQRTGRDGRTIKVNDIGKRKPTSSATRETPAAPTPTAAPTAAAGDYPAVALPVVPADDAKTDVPEDAADGSKAITLDAWTELKPAERVRLIKEAAGTSKFNAQGDNDNIEWARWSWNPVTGCLHNCPYCYARDLAVVRYEHQFTPSIIPARLKAPVNTPFPTKKAAESLGHKNVFTCSMADLFGRWAPKEWIEAVLDAVRAAPQWNFLFLTKFPLRLAEFKFPDNAWVGATVDCQARVKATEKAFRKVEAGVKWLSCEPLLEPLRFSYLGLFDWVVLGGASRSTQTPEWHPPRAWVNDLEAAARAVGCKIYEKANLLERVRQYPGVDVAEPTQAPEALRYLPKDDSR